MPEISGSPPGSSLPSGASTTCSRPNARSFAHPPDNANNGAPSRAGPRMTAAVTGAAMRRSLVSRDNAGHRPGPAALDARETRSMRRGTPPKTRGGKAMRKATRRGAAIGIAAAILLSAVPTRAQPVADFYRGKTLRMLIGYGPGGGYDIYGRLVAEFLPRHLPGNPTIVAQNMPGAGGFVAAKYIYDVAPKDGTVFGSLAQTLALDSMTNTNAKLDVAKMPYVGRVVTNID